MASSLTVTGLVRIVAAQQLRRRPTPLQAFGRQRRGARRPDGCRALDADDIGQAQRGEPAAEGGVVAVAGIGQHHALRHAVGDRLADLLERDLRLGLEGDVLGHAGLPAPRLVIGPGLGQIEPIGDRQAGVLVRHRQRHRDLAVVLLAELAAVLPRHADRMLALLGDAGVVDDPGPDRRLLLNRRQHDTSRTAASSRPRPKAPWPRSGAATGAWRRPRPGAIRAAIGSTLLRSPGSSSPVQ